jgi:putative spermidine/putrescine transport system permease protein
MAHVPPSRAIKYVDKGNMTKDEIDKTMKVLTDAKKSGQFRAFWKTFDESVNIVADFVLTNYKEILSSKVTYSTYLNTLKFAVLTWFFTLTIGFTIAYFLAFHVRTLVWQIALFLICTVPFLTSNIIRMISWIPFLGRHGIFNSTLLAIGLIHEPLEFLLFSDFAVVLAFVHLYTLRCQRLASREGVGDAAV